MMAKMIFVNLPVSDLARSTAFYQAIGAEKNPQFSDDTASCMVISDTIYVMLLTHDKYRQFTSKKIADAKTSSQVLICLSADGRDAVDDMVAKIWLRRRKARVVVPIPDRSRIMASCMAAASRIPMVTTGK
jgi:uncharacterized protein